MPIRRAGQEIIGTFALSSFESRSPSDFHLKLLEIGASIIGIVLERRREADNLRLMGKVFENSNEGILVADAQAQFLAVAPVYGEPTLWSVRDGFGQPVLARLVPLDFAARKALPDGVRHVKQHILKVRNLSHQLGQQLRVALFCWRRVVGRHHAPIHQQRAAALAQAMCGVM